ncbi:MAG: hypothetical protein HQL78_14235 [Magnetococcales bacterium]|nr:hypothetical protein [Magnetococcales bacterium]
MTPTIFLVREGVDLLSDGLGHASPLLPTSEDGCTNAENDVSTLQRVPIILT